MCVMSMVADTWTGDWWKREIVTPYTPPSPLQPADTPEWVKAFVGAVTRAEFEALKKEIAELKELLKAAGRFDRETGQPNCEKPDKLRLIAALAEALGVDFRELGSIATP